MTAEQLAVLLARLPPEQRWAAGQKIAEAVKRGYTNIRLFDGIKGAEPGDFTMHDLIGERPHRKSDGPLMPGEPARITEFLFGQDGL